MAKIWRKLTVLLFWGPSCICRTYSSSVRCHRLLGLLYLPLYKLPTAAVLDMHHLSCGISSLLHSVNLILFTVLLVYLILCGSPHSHHLRSHHLLFPQPFNPDLKLISSQILSSVVTLIPSEQPSRILTCADLKGHWRFVCFSFFFFYIFCFCLRVLD